MYFECIPEIEICSETDSTNECSDFKSELDEDEDAGSAAAVAAAASAAEDRHRGMLGAIRYAEAEALEQQAAAAAAAAAAPPSATAGPDDEPPADPMPLLEQAVQKASRGEWRAVPGAARGSRR